MSIRDMMGGYEPLFMHGNEKTDFSELQKLMKMLIKAGIPCRHNIGMPNSAFHLDHFEQVEYLGFHGERISDAVIIYSLAGRPMSYGAPLLEIMGLTENGDDVEGGLTAEEVFKRWNADFKKKRGAKE